MKCARSILLFIFLVVVVLFLPLRSGRGADASYAPCPEGYEVQSLSEQNGGDDGTLVRIFICVEEEELEEEEDEPEQE